MLQLQNITLRRGAKTLLEQANCLIHQGEKVGFIGSNGAGKSSLFALFEQQLEPESGEVSFAKQVRIAKIRQEIPHGEQKILDYVLAGDAQVATTKQQILAAEQTNDGMQLAELHQRYLELDGYSAESRAAKLLIGLGFSQVQLNHVIDDFSGGWRMRLNLARVLMAPADLLLLDEPTNHLDLEAIVWLEQWLQSVKQTVLIISHDREFLDNTVKRIIHFNQTKLKSYTGNYSSFEKQYAEQLILQAKTHAKQQQKISHLQSYVDRFRAKATKAKQAQSRLKMIQKMDKVAPVQATNPFHFEFRPAPDASNPMLSFDKVSIGYDDKPILTNVGFSIYSSDRIALLGPNGAGKSTFVKALAEQLAVQGKVTRSNKLHIGYFTQHQLESLQLDEHALWHVKQLANDTPEKDLRSFLGGFNFQGDRVFEPVRTFSGGEKARLALALLVWQQPNLLLLDEPSNHLDLEMREALASALQSYDGALILITHDRYLLKTLVDDLYLVAHGKVERFANDVDAYQHWLLNQYQAETVAKPKKTKRVIAPKINTEKLEQQITKLEHKLQRQQQQHAELDIAIAEQYSQGETDVENLLQQQQTSQTKITELEQQILVLYEQL